MAAITIRIPTLLGRFADDRQTIDIEAATVDEAVETLLRKYPALEPHLFRRERELRPHIQLFVNERDRKWLDDPNPELTDGDELTFLQAVSGG